VVDVLQGTMTHMAPEIMIKGHISKAADVYALGMVLWGECKGSRIVDTRLQTSYSKMQYSHA
jgi:serine/threonine protein kinase